MHAACKKEKNGWFINALRPGKDCVVTLNCTDGSIVRLVTLTEEESDQLWKGTNNGEDYVILTTSSLISDGKKITLIDEQSSAEAWIYGKGQFKKRTFRRTQKLESNFPPACANGWCQGYSFGGR